MRKLEKKQYYRLLQGGFEPPAQESKVLDFAYCPLNKTGELYNPIIDQEWVTTHDKPSWPDGKDFAVCLSHDVDAVSEVSLQQNIRSIAKLLKTYSDRPFGETLRWVLIYKMNAIQGLVGRKDQLCEFDQWLQVEQEVGAHSTFFFAPEHVNMPHATDCMYTFKQKIEFRGQQTSVAEMMRTLDHEGWEIGLHPSWNAHNSVQEMTSQKQQIENVLGHEIQSVRQHFLKYDRLETPRTQHAAGFKYDGTLGFNDNLGHRRGTSYPFTSYDLKQDEALPLIHIPLTAQDGAIMLASKGLRLDSKTAVEYVELMLERVKNVGGVLSLSWHPHTIHQPGFWDVYKSVLSILAKENSWFATMGEIGDWWTKNTDIDLMKFTQNLRKSDL